MKWVFVVIALFADGVKAGDELGFRERRLFGNCLCGHEIHVPSLIRSILPNWGAVVLRPYHSLCALWATSRMIGELQVAVIVRTPCHRRRFRSRHPVLRDAQGC